MAVILVLGATSCGVRPEIPPSYSSRYPVWQTQPTKIEEVAPPRVIQELRQILEVYQPQVTILSPQLDELFNDSTVTVDLAVEDLPLFKDPQLGLGPHLEVILDNQPLTRIYDLKVPTVLTDLSPGTHTLRVFADRPWDESFKNEGSYAQTTFHIFTKTEDNNPDRALPLLTYNSPNGSYGAEPILLDFYLSGAPLHLVAQEYPDDDILDWRIRCTINGESFYLDQWQPIYLKGFKPGQNWVQLEFIDELGRSIKNEFNNTVRLITYLPDGQDTQSRLLRGELTAAGSQAIVDPSYTPSSTPEEVAVPPVDPTAPAESESSSEVETIAVPESQPKEAEQPESSSEAETIAVPESQPKEAEQPESVFPESSIETSATQSQSQNISEETTASTEVTPLVEPESPLEPVSETPKSSLLEGLLSRFRRTAPSEVTAAPTISDEASREAISPSVSEPASEVRPTSETPLSGGFLQGLLNLFRRTAPSEVTSAPTVSDDASPKVISPSLVEEQITASEETPAIEEQITASEETLAIEEQITASEETPAIEVTPSMDSEQTPVREQTLQETEKIAPPASVTDVTEVKPSLDPGSAPVNEQISSQSQTNAE
ncbi:MAG: hypothetical protein AB4352_25225 [Hormoscilla sp.]